MKLFTKMYKYEEDYDTIKTWAMKMGLGFPQEECLPGVGAIIVDEEGNKYGCGFLYLDNETFVSVMEWVFVNPDIKPRLKVKVYQTVLEAMEGCAKAEGHPVMFTGCNSEGLTRFYKKKGWTVMEKNVTHLIKNLSIGE